jgi:superfamily II DNA or RNA helicase
MALLRDYQEECIAAVKKGFLSARSQLAVLTTGLGKTVIAANLIRDWLPRRSLFLAHTDELITQPLDVLHTFAGIIAAKEKAQSYASLNAPVVVGSIQTMVRRLDNWPGDHFDYLICDEAHLSRAPSWEKVIAHFSKAKLLGLTATPYRADLKSLNTLYEQVAYEKRTPHAVREGWLVPIRVKRAPIQIDLEEVRLRRSVSGLDYDPNDVAHALDPYLDRIAAYLKAECSHRHILAFLPLVATSQKFANACQNAGLSAVHVDGNDPQRAQKLCAFEEGQIKVLTNAALVSVGYDAPRCDAILPLRLTRSTGLYIQQVGRGIRALPGVLDGLDGFMSRRIAIARSDKMDCWIIDMLFQHERHGLIGPGSIYAGGEEDATLMAEAIAAKGERAVVDLEAVSVAVQHEKEEKILRRLQQVATKRSQFFDAQEIAARLHDEALVNYEPVMRWEQRPVTKLGKMILRKHGIDPESVKTDGEATALSKACGRRAYLGLAHLASVRTLITLGVENPETLTQKQADELIANALGI